MSAWEASSHMLNFFHFSGPGDHKSKYFIFLSQVGIWLFFSHIRSSHEIHVVNHFNLLSHSISHQL